jgi:hypothetical protein
MDPKIFKLKEHIKKLASEQKLLKMARKTKLPKDKWEDIRISLGKSKDWTPIYAACEAYVNTIRITACLNLYHELRGSEFRHNANIDEYYYSKCLKEERDLLNK